MLCDSREVDTAPDKWILFHVSYLFLFPLFVIIAQSAALCDPCLRTVQAGEVIQLERKGFFRVDTPYGGSPDKPAVLFLIPDGKGKKVTKK